MSDIISIRLPEDTRKQLKDISRDESRPVSDLVRESLKKYIALYRFRKLKETVLPFAESQGILTDDNILALATDNQADYIITGDKDLLVLEEFALIPIIGPRKFWSIIKNKEGNSKNTMN